MGAGHTAHQPIVIPDPLPGTDDRTPSNGTVLDIGQEKSYGRVSTLGDFESERGLTTGGLEIPNIEEQRIGVAARGMMRLSLNESFFSGACGETRTIGSNGKHGV